MHLLNAEERALADYKKLSDVHLRFQRDSRTAFSAQDGKSGTGSGANMQEKIDSEVPQVSAQPPLRRASCLVPYYMHEGLQPDTAARLRDVVERLERLMLGEKLLSKVVEEYNTSLEQARSYYRPIRTPGLIFPSVRNAALPRLKPQPLHITMLITQRQKSRDRRLLQLKSWQEMQLHLRLEQQFEQSLGNQEPLQPDVKANAAVLLHADAADLRRLNSQFSEETLHKRDQARRSRPSVLTMQRRKQETRDRLKRLRAAS